MRVVWVTGVSGSGKSSVCGVLKEQGYSAIDADWEGFNHWAHRLTGEAVIDPPYPVPPGWLEQYAWRICPHKVRELASRAQDGIAFLCGSVENEADAWQYFDQVVCLVVDDETTVRRVMTRTTNEFGKHPTELAAVLAANRVVEDRYRKLGASIVDAARPLADVVRQLLALVGTPERPSGRTRGPV